MKVHPSTRHALLKGAQEAEADGQLRHPPQRLGLLRPDLCPTIWAREGVCVCVFIAIGSLFAPSPVTPNPTWVCGTFSDESMRSAQ